MATFGDSTPGSGSALPTEFGGDPIANGEVNPITTNMKYKAKRIGQFS